MSAFKDDIEARLAKPAKLERDLHVREKVRIDNLKGSF
jgi:hypothetical protein